MTFYPLISEQEFQPGFQRVFTVAGQQILLLHTGEQGFAVENHCPHQGASLEGADISSDCLRCPVHGIEFEFDGGLCRGPLRTILPALKSFELKLIRGQWGVELA